MAEKNAKIFLKSIQRLDGDEDTIEIIAECGFYKNEEKYYIFYREVYDNGATDCSIKYENKKVTIKRKGDTNANFVCDPDEDTAFIYTTAYGHFSVTVRTKEIEADLSENGGTLRLLYDLKINGVSQENEVNIKIVKA
ncbi:MAG: DUF1934 domain-containing protein [Oscillospiraceae bacterium]|nr:DUF1934 domain-containing protein [Oscillospiraceae bacterium]